MSKLHAWFARVAQTGRLLVGVPSYAAYREHMEHHHPDLPAMDERSFFRNRQQARYGGRGGGRCC